MLLFIIRCQDGRTTYQRTLNKLENHSLKVALPSPKGLLFKIIKYVGRSILFFLSKVLRLLNGKQRTIIDFGKSATSIQDSFYCGTELP